MAIMAVYATKGLWETESRVKPEGLAGLEPKAMEENIK